MMSILVDVNACVYYFQYLCDGMNVIVIIHYNISIISIFFYIFSNYNY